MKKSKWKIIIGVVLTLISLGIAVQLIVHHSDKITETIATITSAICWGGLGLFFIFSYLEEKDREDIGILPISIKPNSLEDVKQLKLKRNSILALLLLISIFASISKWITNNYNSGFTPENVSIIFDIIASLPLIYIIYSLYKMFFSLENSPFFRLKTPHRIYQ